MKVDYGLSNLKFTDMRQLRLFFVITIVMTVLNACNSKQERELFSKTYQAAGELYISGEELADPRFMNVTDNYFVIGNDKGVPLIELRDILTGELLNSFLSTGNGPNEVLAIGNIQIDEAKGYVYVDDLFKRKLLRYTFDDIVKNSFPYPETVYQRSENSSLLFEKLYSGREYIIAESRDPRGRVLLLNSEEKEIGYYLAYPDKSNIDNSLSDIHNAKLYASAITVKPSLDKIALAAYSAGMIDICRIENDQVIGEWSYTSFYPQGIMVVPMGDNSAVAHTKDSRTGFLNASSTEKYVYCLFSGKLLGEESSAYGNEVYVVGWDGRETYKIVLDRQVNRIAVDSRDRTIYGITPEMDIVRFKISK